MVDEVSAGLNPARYVAGLGRAATKAGAEIFEHTRVEGVQRESRQGESGWKITTSRGPLWAREVFAATSGYTSKATPALQKKLIPIGSFIITTQVLPEALAHELSPRNRMIYDSKNYLYYYRLTPDRRMLFGGRAAFFPETDQTIRRSAEILRRRHDRRLSPTPRRQNRIRLGRHARLRLRHHAPRRPDSTACTTP